jgi:FkbM family methyltransferase
MSNRLIFDIGFHKGEDTLYYLHKGYRVIAVDADPNLISLARKKHSNDFKSGKLELLNYAIAEQNDLEVIFNISELTLWNSMKPEVAGRENVKVERVKVKTRRLDNLFSTYGLPYYCKIDIEGYDALALSTIKESSFRPEYISVEVECLGDSEIITEEKSLETLNRLRDLGYNNFKLVDQKTLTVLNEQPFYIYKKPVKNTLFRRGIYKLSKFFPAHEEIPDNVKRLRKKHNYKFPIASSGPFGEDLEGEWKDYESAKKILLFHRKMYFMQPRVVNYSFWCDWHAAKG